MIRQTYLDTDVVGKSKCNIGMLFEVICNRDRLRVIAHSEHRIARASAAQLLDDDGTIFTGMGRPNSHVGDKLLQTKPVSVRKPALGRECSWIIFLEELHEKADQLSCLVHDSSCDVDIQIHSILGRTDGLEVSPP